MVTCPYCGDPVGRGTRGKPMATCGDDECRRKLRADQHRKRRGQPTLAEREADTVEPVGGPFETPFGTFADPRTAWEYALSSDNYDLGPGFAAEMDERFKFLKPYRSQAPTIDDLLAVDDDVSNCPQCITEVIEKTSEGYRCTRCGWQGQEVMTYTFPQCPACQAENAQPTHDGRYQCPACTWQGDEDDFWAMLRH